MNKKILTITLLALTLPGLALAQGGAKSRERKETSPFLEGRHKVRRTDYDSIWKFTTFGTKEKYYCNFDYTQFASLAEQRSPNYGNFEPVMNFLNRSTRTPMRICAIYAVNPNIGDAAKKNSLKELAKEEALQSLQALQKSMKDRQMKNKLQLFTAEVDYRYWQGADYFANEQPTDPLVKVGLILFFGTKKIDLFPNAADTARTFNNVKFFPNDATVVESYESLMDELAAYLKGNDRYEVLLTGYTDNQGTAAYCEGLSRQRATEVKKKLILRGIPEHRIEVEAKGSANPIGDNDTYEGRIANNRVTIQIQ
ncbi:MAG: OmpA family protein [Bacteroidales bacterium]|nr:OmpA family protein [Bacteroidales bacterium]